MTAERKLVWVLVVLGLWALGEFLAGWLYPANEITLYVR